VTWVDGRGDGRAEVNVAKAEDEVACIETDAFYVVDGGEAIDAADELDVAGAPRRVLADGLHVLAGGEERGLVFPG